MQKNELIAMVLIVLIITVGACLIVATIYQTKPGEGIKNSNVPTLSPTSPSTTLLSQTNYQPLPLTERYTNNECQFSLKVPDGWVVAGGQIYTPWYDGIYYSYYVVKKQFAEQNPQPWGTRIISRENLTSYTENSAMTIELWFGDDYKWQWIVDGLIRDQTGTTYHTLYQNETVNTGIIGNSVIAKRIVDTNVTQYAITYKAWKKYETQLLKIPSDSPPATFLPYADKIITADKQIGYITVDRSSKGFRYYFVYSENKKINGQLEDFFNIQTFEEIMNSFRMVKA